VGLGNAIAVSLRLFRKHDDLFPYRLRGPAGQNPGSSLSLAPTTSLAPSPLDPPSRKTAGRILPAAHRPPPTAYINHHSPNQATHSKPNGVQPPIRGGNREGDAGERAAPDVPPRGRARRRVRAGAVRVHDTAGAGGGLRRARGGRWRWGALRRGRLVAPRRRRRHQPGPAGRPRLREGRGQRLRRLRGHATRRLPRRQGGGRQERGRRGWPQAWPRAILRCGY
jgi:hypothetical protein